MKFQYYFEGGNILDSVPLFYLLSGRPKAFQWEPKKIAKVLKSSTPKVFSTRPFSFWKNRFAMKNVAWLEMRESFLVSLFLFYSMKKGKTQQHCHHEILMLWQIQNEAKLQKNDILTFSLFIFFQFGSFCYFFSVKFQL